jgi:hypothetical protein
MKKLIWISIPINQIVLLILSMLFLPNALEIHERKKICFISEGNSLEILNGNVKQVTYPPSYEGPNPGQDYTIVDIDDMGDVSKITTGFHGSVFKTYYVTERGADGRKIETRGYTLQSDLVHQLPDSLLRSQQSDTAKTLLLVYRYNDKNEIINYVVSPGKRYADSSAYKYNDRGQLIELDHFTYSKLLMDVTKYKYDLNNNLIELNKFHWNRLMDKANIKYLTFDSNNNWIKLTSRAEMFLTSPSEVWKGEIIRKITYY